MKIFVLFGFLFHWQKKKYLHRKPKIWILFFLKERKEGKKKEKGKSKILIWLNEKSETLVCCMAWSLWVLVCCMAQNSVVLACWMARGWLRIVFLNLACFRAQIKKNYSDFFHKTIDKWNFLFFFLFNFFFIILIKLNSK